MRIFTRIRDCKIDSITLYIKIIADKKVTAKVTQKVTVNQQKILDVIKNNSYIAQEELAQIAGITRKSVIANMKKLQANGLIKRIGADKNGYWQVEEN